MNAKIERYESRLIAASGRLDGLSPAKRLASGFGYLTGPDGKKVDSVSNLSIGDSLSIRVKDGMLESQITSISKDK